MDEKDRDRAENIYATTLKNPTTSERSKIVQGVLIDTFIEHLKGDSSKAADAIAQCAVILAYAMTFLWGNQVNNLGKTASPSSFGGVLGMILSTFIEFTNSIGSMGIVRTMDAVTGKMVEETDTQANPNFKKLQPRSMEHLFAMASAIQISDTSSEEETKKLASSLMYNQMRELGKAMITESPHKEFQLAVIKGCFDGLTTSVAWQLSALRRVMESCGEDEATISKAADDLLETFVKVARTRFHMAMAKDQLSRAEPAGNA